MAAASVAFLILSMVKLHVKPMTHGIFLLAALHSVYLALNDTSLWLFAVTFILAMLIASIPYTNYIPFLYASSASLVSITCYCVKMTRFDFSPFLLFCTFAPIVLFIFLIKRYLMQQSNIKTRELEGLFFSANHDPLTGLPNRLLFYDRLNQAILSLNRTGKSLAVLFLDIDSFKSVNDSAGHFAGDKLLYHFGRRIESVMRESDTLARFGGDEFVILVPCLDDPSTLEHIIQRIKQSLNEPFLIESTDYKISASIGVCLYPTDARDAETLIYNADLEMFKSKKKQFG